MKALADRIATITGGCRERGHPIDLDDDARAGVPEGGGRDVARARPGRADPEARTLVVASPFDAALHDAYGKAHGRSCYRAYGPDFLPHDLGQYLGAGVRGRAPRPLRVSPTQARACRSTTWSARSDPITDADLTARVGDGLPETLAEWIPHDGLTHIKIKLNGDDRPGTSSACSRSSASSESSQAQARRRELALLARLQRALPERRLPARVPARRSARAAPRRSTASSTSSSRRAATSRPTAPTSCTRPRSCGRS